MTAGKQRVRFVSHDASRSGAPILLLRLMRWLRENTDIDMGVLLLDGGPLEPDFAALGSVHILRDLTGEGSALTTTGRLIRRLGTPPTRDQSTWGRTKLERRFRMEVYGLRRRAGLRRLHALGPWDLTYVNSLPSAHALGWLTTTEPMITHFHEMLDQPNNKLWVEYERPLLTELMQRSRRVIAVSTAARQTVIDQLQLSPRRVELCYAFVAASDAVIDEASVARARADLDIPPDAFIIGGSGNCEWRKGPELFVQLAIMARRRGLLDRLRFVWLGADPTLLQTRQQLVDIDRAGLSGYVHLVGVERDPRPYLGLFDAFALTSRSDPFPLVCLEVASNGTPILCFEGGGGMPEFVRDSCGFVVPYAELAVMLTCIEELMKDPGLRRQLGERGAEKVREEHDVSFVAPEIWRIMQSCMTGAQ